MFFIQRHDFDRSNKKKIFYTRTWFWSVCMASTICYSDPISPIFTNGAATWRKKNVCQISDRYLINWESSTRIYRTLIIYINTCIYYKLRGKPNILYFVQGIKKNFPLFSSYRIKSTLIQTHARNNDIGKRQPSETCNLHGIQNSKKKTLEKINCKQLHWTTCTMTHTWHHPLK